MNNVLSVKKFTLSLLAGSLCLSAMLPMSAMAEGPGYHKRPDFQKNLTPEQKEAWKAKKEAHHAKIQQELGISPEQADKLKAIREQNKGQAKALHEQLHGKRKALMEYMSSDSADQGKAQAMQQEIDQLQGKLSDLRLNTWFEMKKNLTPEQLAKMKQLREQHRQNRGKGHGPNGGVRTTQPAAQ